MKKCLRNHPFEGKICLECGYISPLEKRAKIGPFQISGQLISRQDANLYLIEQGGKSLALWELRELFQAEHREQLMQALKPAPKNILPVISHFVDDEVRGGPVGYFIQPSEVLVHGVDLDALIRKQGVLASDLIHSLMTNLLDVLVFLEANNFSLNGFSSSMVRVFNDQAYLSFPFYGDLLDKPRVLSLKTLYGFSPPEGLRTGLLFRETDRFGLAMILFHCLTGLSPALWAPDVPKLTRYKYIWAKDVLDFYQMLLSPLEKYSAQQLKEYWLALKLKPKTPDMNTFAHENKSFYHALELVANNELRSALDLLADFQESQLHNPHITSLMADIFVDLKEATSAAYYYGESIRREKLGGTYLKLGRFYLHEGQLRRAEKAFEFALTELSYVPEPFWQMAKINLYEEKYHRALQWIEQSEKVRPTQEASEIKNKIEQALQPGISQKSDKDGFSFRYERWDRDFQKRRKECKYACPEGHEQTSDVLQCQSCGRLMHYQVGESIQSYQICDVIAARDLKKKHNSSTYLAKDSQGHEVIIKEIYQESSGLERYQRELKALSAIKHPAVPTLLSSFEYKERLYQVQEFRQGDNLEALVRAEGCLPEAEVRLIIQQALNLIIYLQGLDLVHADIKPKNILWDRENQRLSLLDFDVSVFLDGEDVGKTPGATEHFAAPEQKDAYIVSLHSDPFSLALTAVFLLTGFTPELFKYYFPKRAYRNWKAYLHIHPTFEQFLTQVLVIAASKRVYKKADELLERWQEVLNAPLLNKDIETQQELVRTYYLFHKSEDLGELQAYCKQIMHLRPDAKMHYLMAHELLDKGYAEHAKDYYRGAITLDTEWPYPYWELAQIHTEQKNLGRALDILKRADKESGKIAYTLTQLGHIYRQTTLWREALSLFEQALGLEPKNTKALLGKAHVLILLQLFQDAEKVCKQVLLYDPDNARAYHILHMILGTRNDFAKAIEFGQRASLLQPDNALILFDLGLTYYRANRFVEAVDVLQNCLYKAPELLDAHFFLGSAYLMQGQHDAAEQHLQVALKTGKQVDVIQKKLEVIQHIRERMAAVGY